MRPVPTPRVEEPLPSEGELRKAQVENVLLANCGACHAPVLGDEAFGGIGFIDDIDELTEQGYIVPLRSEASRLIQVIRNGSMPPRNSGWPPMTDADLDILVRYIDEPRLWPIFAPVGGRADAGPPAVTDAGPGAG